MSTSESRAVTMMIGTGLRLRICWQISIPDWSAAPAGARFGNPDSLRLTIDGFNAVARTESATRGFVFVDIAELSRSRLAEEGWTSGDGLHPGDPQYAAWADHIWDQVREAWRA